MTHTATPSTWQDDDKDSALGDLDDESDDSLASSVCDLLEHGREYHSFYSKKLQYPYPNDQKEQDRLDWQHNMIYQMHGKRLYRAPIERHHKRVLDLGTGTGAWAVAFADEHQHSRVLGVDISIQQPTLVPPNCRFQIWNYLDEWDVKRTFEFDYIHIRMPVIKRQSFNGLLSKILRSLSPGGWLEIEAMCLPTSDDNSIPVDSALQQWISAMTDAMWKAGYDPGLARKYKKMLRAVGFKKVGFTRKKLPQNPWPSDNKRKELGALNQINIEEGIEGFSLRLFIGELGWEFEEVQVLLAKVRHDIRNPNIHANWEVYTAWGQKGLSTSRASGLSQQGEPGGRPE